MAREWPLMGRAGELRQLETLLRDPCCPGVLLAGPAGVGKTRLAEEALALAARSGMASMHVVATRAAKTLAFGALAPLLPAAGGHTSLVSQDPADLLRRYAAALSERAGGRRLVLLVDDAHLLDDPSATLVHQLAAGNTACVLATLRAGETAPDPILALWKDLTVERIELSGLRAEAVGELLATVLGGPVDPAAAALLAVRCEGNVLFLRELVFGALADGTLREELGVWRLVGSWSPSNRLVELVESTLSGLDPAERELLEVVAFAEVLGPGELSRLAPQGLASRLERQGLLAARREGRRLEVRLVHPLYGDVLRARTPALGKTDMARSLAEGIESLGARRREDVLRVASWRLESGGARPELMLAAATTARWRYDFGLAERLARAALDAGAGFDAAILAAQLAILNGRETDAEAELERLAQSAHTDAERGLVAITRLDNSGFYLGRIGDALRVAEAAEAAIADPAWRDEIAARRSGILLGTDGPRAGAEAAEPLLERADGRALAWASIIGSYSLGRLGRLQAALDASERGYAAHLVLTEPLEWYPWFHLLLRCEALAALGRLDEAETLARQQYDQGVVEGSSEAQALFAWQLTKPVGDRGDVRAAIGYGRTAVSLFRQNGRQVYVQTSLVGLAHALALGGHATEASAALKELDELGLPSPGWTAVNLVQARAWTAVAHGNVPAAADLLEEAAALGERNGDIVGAASALHGIARLGRARQVVSRLSELAAGIDGALAPARAKHAAAQAKGDPSELSAVADGFAELGAHLLAAEAATDAAVAWRRAGDGSRASTAERRAATLAGRCPEAATPALQGVDTRSRLSPGERETALLAAAGRSNKEIADQLVVSLRTVENRLYRVYEKLGVSGRDELHDALS